MSAHDHPDASGITELEFSTSLGTPIEGLRYRLSDGRGHARPAITGAGGTGIRLRTGFNGSAPEAPDLWVLEGPATILLEVQRDDGSWKLIGSFQHAANSHKHVRVIAPTVAVPLQMDPI
ncbi:hypothetical protein [Stenotrophomonas sp. 24(2023)]|uniref:hypothetical protein n=1 Tax=Stenotrophomonas sp. 24(2023) TaxID=3068324 RepID=UPI0027DF00DF|nr:hypothetical protein [Stenotrophomonas sp. 24(2023)]WMJ70889.1 hypothetical protein Q9R17_07275 [Stenotrophomonas sp. 24(2023)]